MTGEKEYITREAKSPRHEGLEMGRVLATVAVIIIHMPTFFSKYLHFAVPFFFGLSGYLLAKSINNGDLQASHIKKFTVRHWRLLLIWAAFYSLLPLNWPQILSYDNVLGSIKQTYLQSQDKFSTNPVNWFLDGPPNGFHLWYLAIAPLATALLFILVKLNLRVLLIPIALSSIFSLLILTPEQCSETAYWAAKTKFGILIALPSVIFGYEYYLRWQGKSSLLIGGGIMTVGVLMTIAQLHSATTSCMDAGSIITGAGLLMVLIGLPKVAFGEAIVLLGKLTLGAYILHLAIRPLIFSLSHKMQWQTNFEGISILTVLSFFSAWLFLQNKHLKKLLS